VLELGRAQLEVAGKATEQGDWAGFGAAMQGCGANSADGSAVIQLADCSLFRQLVALAS
jgi:hypothetical protein